MASTRSLTLWLNRFNAFLKSPWLPVVAILAWGVLLLKYWITGKLNILIHPNYFGLTIVGGVGLLAIGGFKAKQLLQERQGYAPTPTLSPVQHISLFPPGWSSALLLVVAIAGLLITPRTFGSQTALQRGLTESLPITRSQPQSFRSLPKPEARSLIEWIRLLNVNPEPDTYKGQAVNVTGFIIYPPDLPENYLWLARFVITCCAADAYPVGLPVLLPEGYRKPYPQDTWLNVKGQMTTALINGERKLTIQAASLTPIPEPKNPYDY